MSNTKSLYKDKLIPATLNTQNLWSQNPHLQRWIEREDLDRWNLKLNQRFNGKIKAYASYKISIKVKATFESPKYDITSFYIQFKRYTRFETNKRQRILKNLQSGIDTKDTEGSGWKVLQLTKFS